MHCAALPREVHPPPPTSDLITRCQPEVEVASSQATTQRSFPLTKMRESQAIPALLHRGGAVGSQFSFPIYLVAEAGEDPRRGTFRKRSPAVARPLPRGLRCARPPPRCVGLRAPGLAQVPAGIPAPAGARPALPPGPLPPEDHALCPRCLLLAGCAAPARWPRALPPLPVWRPPRAGSAVAQPAPRPSHPSASRRLLTPGVTSPRRRPPLQRAELGGSSY